MSKPARQNDPRTSENKRGRWALWVGRSKPEWRGGTWGTTAPPPHTGTTNPGANCAKEPNKDVRPLRLETVWKGDASSSILHMKRLSATDISALASMKNVAKCDTWCELQNPVNHRVFERKLRPKPSGRGHACLGVTQRRQQQQPPHPPCEGDGEGWRILASRAQPLAVGPNNSPLAMAATACGGWKHWLLEPLWASLVDGEQETLTQASQQSDPRSGGNTR